MLNEPSPTPGTHITLSYCSKRRSSSSNYSSSSFPSSSISSSSDQSRMAHLITARGLARCLDTTCNCNEMNKEL